MRTRNNFVLSPLLLFFLFFLFLFFNHSIAQPETQQGFTCTPNQTTNPCQAYVFYRAMAPDFLNLAAIGDLFALSRLEIAQPSNISNVSFPLVPNEPLFIPITCSCNPVIINNTSTSISYANLSFTINQGDTFYLVSTNKFQNLTAYPSVEVVNPNLEATNLPVGVTAIFPIFCKCPNKTQLGNQVKYLVSYVIQPSDNLSSIASRFAVDTQSIVDANGNSNLSQPFDTIFVPVNQLSGLTQPTEFPSPPPVKTEEKGVNKGLAIGLAVCGFLLILVSGLWVCGVVLFKKRRGGEEDEKQKLQVRGKGGVKGIGVNLMADVSDCLDKYRVFGIDELNEATDGFSEKSLIQGSVYKGCIAGDVYAVKKMKWDAYEELKILQKVNHGNLVKIEGFCIDPEDASCYLIYEYIENGSLYSWLHENQENKLDWKTRLRIGIDIAHGLQYIHEHTRPRVVHKDIKSSNILLDSNMRAKIANFGLAKSGCNAITMHIVGTQGYIAPEYLVDGVVSTKMDVFAFGVVLLELVSGKEAIDEDDGSVLWVQGSAVMERNDEKQRVERLRNWMDEALVRHEQSFSIDSVMDVMNIAVACVQKDPTKRPSMVEIVYALSKSDEGLFDMSEDNLSATPLAAR